MNCDIDIGIMTLSQGHDTIVWSITSIQIQHDTVF